MIREPAGPPRIGPRGTVILAGPEVEYRVGSLETAGHRAVVHLETVDGRDWSADRHARSCWLRDERPGTGTRVCTCGADRPAEEASTYVLRRRDEAARRAWVEEPDPESLQAARLGIEHVEHHGRPLRFVGSSYGPGAIHRFACDEDGCPFVLAWSVTA